MFQKIIAMIFIITSQVTFTTAEIQSPISIKITQTLNEAYNKESSYKYIYDYYFRKTKNSNLLLLLKQHDENTTIISNTLVLYNLGVQEADLTTAMNILQSLEYKTPTKELLCNSLIQLELQLGDFYQNALLQVKSNTQIYNIFNNFIKNVQNNIQTLKDTCTS